MNTVIKSGQPDVMRDIEGKVNEMNLLFEKLEKVNKKIGMLSYLHF